KLDNRLLALLVCPICTGPLKYDRENNELISVAEGLAFPIRDGIPVLLESEARSLDAPASAKPPRPGETVNTLDAAGTDATVPRSTSRDASNDPL
ncbi:MAG: hypothetical protein JWQ11_3625, partial [Rhizobacter sp.]|nr:hypothetical protein [Rhizobacter sp.]